MAVLSPRTSDGVAEGIDRNWVFSDMAVEHLPEVLAIERVSFPTPWTGPLFLQELQVAFSRIILARRPGAPIAGYVCRWFVADEVHVLNVAVAPQFRTQGLGGLLMHEILREARENQATAVTLEVRRGNRPGRRLYESFGFEEVGLRRNYYGRGEDALILRLALAHD
jgi:ribosomal-protein-alanine N-acetyltransferase